MADLHSVSFVDAHHGWAVGTIYDAGRGRRTGVVLATDDGGIGWREQYTTSEGGLVGVEFVDRQHGWAACSDGVVLATTDRGTTWQTQWSGCAWLTGLDFIDASHGWLSGRGMLATSTGGFAP